MEDPNFTQEEWGVFLAIKSVISILNPITGKLPYTPTHLFFAWDGTAKRDKGRAEKPPEYHTGKVKLATALQTIFGASQAYPEGEADDACATAAHQAAKDPVAEIIYVVSGDKDLMQVVTERICYYSLNEKCVLNWPWILNKWKIKHPSHLSIALAILGDAGDGINGVDKMGGKAVEKLFQPIDETMNLLEVAELVSARMSEPQMRQFEESLELTLLRLDIPNLPAPAPIVICERSMLQDLNLDAVWNHLELLKASYESSCIKEDQLD
jgi:5'-3' exonuclease